MANNVVGGGWKVRLLTTNNDNSFGPGFTLTVYVNCATAN
jgi:hypothetical protein